MASEHILQIPLPPNTQIHVFFWEIKAHLIKNFANCSIHFLPYFDPRTLKIYLPPLCQKGSDLYLLFSNENAGLSEIHLASYLKLYQANVHKAKDHIAENIYAQQFLSPLEQLQEQPTPQKIVLQQASILPEGKKIKKYQRQFATVKSLNAELKNKTAPLARDNQDQDLAIKLGLTRAMFEILHISSECPIRYLPFSTAKENIAVSFDKCNHLISSAALKNIVNMINDVRATLPNTIEIVEQNMPDWKATLFQCPLCKEPVETITENLHATFVCTLFNAFNWMDQNPDSISEIFQEINSHSRGREEGFKEKLLEFSGGLPVQCKFKKESYSIGPTDMMIEYSRHVAQQRTSGSGEPLTLHNERAVYLQLRKQKYEDSTLNLIHQYVSPENLIPEVIWIDDDDRSLFVLSPPPLHLARTIVIDDDPTVISINDSEDDA